LVTKNFEIHPFSDEFNDIKVIKFSSNDDDRGLFRKIYESSEINSEIGNLDEVYYSTSRKNVIRGIHLQKDPFRLSKLVTCIDGEIIDLFIDLRKKSKNYKKFQSLQIDLNTAVIIPYGYGHGFSVISEKATVLYCQKGVFNKESEVGINPLSLNFDWKVSSPLLSDKDKNFPNIDKFEIEI
jgi:dTDP-4-dehydrorhamnose 3,5-epimerase|tara:strand:- start:275 stop:820 length:546 start_codon:yes stop_codon:yes gene_type:complete